MSLVTSSPPPVPDAGHARRRSYPRLKVLVLGIAAASLASAGTLAAAQPIAVAAGGTATASPASWPIPHGSDPSPASAPGTAGLKGNGVAVDCNPAHYNGPSGNTGAPIPWSQVAPRAQSWTSVNVPYSQSCMYSNRYGTYRTDCSGFVSMAWGLPYSYNTYALNPNEPGNANLTHVIPWSQLQPGDALIADNSQVGHVTLFTGWQNSAHTIFTVSEEEDTQYGTVVRPNRPVSYYQAAGYSPIRYNNFQTGSTAPVSDLGGSVVNSMPGETDFLSATSANQVRWNEFDTASGWQPVGVTNGPSPSPLVGDLDATTWGGGRVDIAARDSSNRLVTRTYAQNQGWGGWVAHPGVIMQSAPTIVSDAVGKLYVFYRGGSNTLWQVSWNSATGWSGPSEVLGVHNVASGPDATAPYIGYGQMTIAYRATDNTIWTITYDHPSGGWRLAGRISRPLPQPVMAVDPAAADYSNGNLTVYYTGSNGTVYHNLHTRAGWGIWSATPGGTSVSSAPDASRNQVNAITVIASNGGALRSSVQASPASRWTNWTPLG